MLEHIERLNDERRYAELRAIPESSYAHLQGEDCARAHLIMVKTFEETATCPDDYRTALRHGQAALAVTSPGSYLHTWALHTVACIQADFGKWDAAEDAAEAFLSALPANPKCEVLLPWVLFALGRVRHYQGNHAAALRYFDKALGAGATGAIRERIALFVVWTKATRGHVNEAKRLLPASVENVPNGLLDATAAMVYASAGEWQAARSAARSALVDAKEWAIYDSILLAELYLILKSAATGLTHHREAAIWSLKFRTALLRWNADLLPCRVLTLRRGEVNPPYAAVVVHCAHGSVGYARSSLTGTVG